jgi:hypothetical protein
MLTRILRADLLVNVSLTRAAWFRSNNVLIPFGCDFQFQNAWMMYKNMVCRPLARTFPAPC